MLLALPEAGCEGSVTVISNCRTSRLVPSLPAEVSRDLGKGSDAVRKFRDAGPIDQRPDADAAAGETQATLNRQLQEELVSTGRCVSHRDRKWRAQRRRTACTASGQPHCNHTGSECVQ
jgi:hypothetical protein